MKLIEYVEKIQQVKNEIVGCDNLIEFYTHKKDQLQKEYERLKLIAENEPIAKEIEKFISDNSKVFKLTVETVKLSDKDKVIDAMNAYNKLSNDAKFAVHSYYVQLKNLNAKIELLQKAKDEADAALKADAELRKEAETLVKQFRKDNKYVLSLKAKDIMSFHGEPIQTALAQFEALSGLNIYIKEYLKEEEALLLSLLSVWEALTKEEELTPEQQQAQNFKNTFAYVLSLTEKTVSADDAQELAIAMSVYDILSDDVKDKTLHGFTDLELIKIRKKLNNR